MQADNFDAIVVGGGVVGLSSAWRAAQAGLRVCVLERDDGRRSAAHAAAGIIAPDTEAEPGREAFLPLAHRSAELYPAFVAELEAETGADVGYQRCGTLFAAFDRDEVEIARREYDLQVRFGLAPQWLAGSDCRAVEPGLATTCAGGLFAAHEAQVDPRRLLAALEAALLAAGGEVRRGAEVVGGVHDEGRLRGVVTRDGSTVRAERVLLAAGAWAAACPLGSEPLPVRPVKGQVVRLHARAGEHPAERIVRAERVYIVPRASGEVVVGATMEERGFDERVTAGAVHELLREAYRAVPELAELELVEAAAGFRPATPDNGPLLGEWGDEGLLVAAGHYRNGILLAPATAEAAVALLTGAALPPEAEPFAPARFACEVAR